MNETQVFLDKMLDYRAQSVFDYLSAKDDLEELEDCYV